MDEAADPVDRFTAIPPLPDTRAEKLQTLEMQLVEAEGIITQAKRRRWLTIGFMVLSTVAMLLCILFVPGLAAYFEDFPNLYLLMVFSLIVGMAMVFFWFEYQISQKIRTVDQAKAQKRIFFELEPIDGAGEGPATSYFDSLVRINVENLAEYYVLVKVHTDNSFRVSVASGLLGFVVIIAGLGFSFFDHPNVQGISFLVTGAGIIIEFITGIFFYLYNRTVISLKDYHDSLLAVQNILLSFKIVEDTEDSKERAKMVQQMIGFLIGSQSQPQLAITEMPKSEQS